MTNDSYVFSLLMGLVLLLTVLIQSSSAHLTSVFFNIWKNETTLLTYFLMVETDFSYGYFCWSKACSLFLLVFKFPEET